MEDGKRKVIGWTITIIVGLIVFFAVRGIFNCACYSYSQNGFKIEKEEVGFVYDQYYTGSNLYPDRCPALKLTIKNTSGQSLYVYGEVNFYKDGTLFETAYIRSNTLASGDTATTTVSAKNGVTWNYFESYNWSYKIVSIKCNYV